MKPQACLIALCAIAVLLGTTEARKSLTKAPLRKVREEKKVADGTGCTNNEFCLFNTGSNYWCFNPQTPLLKLGWETD